MVPLQTMASNVRMAEAVEGTTKVMGEFNKQMDPQKLAKTMQEFEKANMQLDMGDEMSTSLCFLTYTVYVRTSVWAKLPYVVEKMFGEYLDS